MIISDLHLIAGIIISGWDYKCLSFQDSASPQRFPTGFLLPTVRNKVDDVPTVPTAPPTTARTTTSTTTTEKTTTTTTFELTPLSTEPTTPRVYVSTSNFRPTLPNFGQEEEEQSSQQEEQEEVVEEPETEVSDVKVPRVPLVLAPQPATSTTTRTKPTTSRTTTTTITSASTTTSSSSTSESSFNIHNRLDELASNLDPWAHIQQAAKKVSSVGLKWWLDMAGI